MFVVFGKKLVSKVFSRVEEGYVEYKCFNERDVCVLRFNKDCFVRAFPTRKGDGCWVVVYKEDF